MSGAAWLWRGAGFFGQQLQLQPARTGRRWCSDKSSLLTALGLPWLLEHLGMCRQTPNGQLLLESVTQGHAAKRQRRALKRCRVGQEQGTGHCGARGTEDTSSQAHWLGRNPAESRKPDLQAWAVGDLRLSPWDGWGWVSAHWGEERVTKCGSGFRLQFYSPRLFQVFKYKLLAQAHL